MTEKSFRRPVRRSLYLAALALIGLSAPLSWGGGVTSAPAEAAARGPQQIGGTWEAAWRNSSGELRRGLIVVQQNGARISARIESHGNVTATGSITGSNFILRGTRLGVPFTVTGRVAGKKMTGMLTAILVERHFTATRRRGR